MAVERDKKKTKGLEKAAIMLLSLPEQQAAKIFSFLGSDEIRELTQAMSCLGTVKPVTIENTMIDFVSQLSSTGSLVGSVENTERLLGKILGQELANQFLEDLRGPAGRTLWDKLSNVHEEMLASYLKNEHPQTVAVVLSRLKADSASRIITILPEALSMEVILRMLRMEPIRKEILDNIEETLRNEFMSNVARSVRRDTHELVAEIFNNFDRTNELKYLKKLEEKNHESAARVRSLMFTFEDLSKIDNNSMQILIRNVDKTKLALSLKGASDDVQDMFYANMSERAAKLMRDDIKAMGMVRLREVEEAQTYVVGVARELAASGSIFLGNSKDEGDQLVG
jgi:flagellar motor switch protein FliG